jgi:serine protease
MSRYQHQEGQPRVVAQTPDSDPELPPRDVLARHGARALDPMNTIVTAEQSVRSTAYVADRLLVPSWTNLSVAERLLGEVAQSLGYQVEIDNSRDRRLERDVVPIQFTVRPDIATLSPDAWIVLQNARARFGFEALKNIGLDHLLFASPGVIGIPYHPTSAGRRGRPESGSRDSTPAPGQQQMAISDYGRQGAGGRQPVTWVGPAPVRSRERSRRPGVVILDNGCGRHPWLDPVVIRDLSLDGIQVGMSAPQTDPERTSDLGGPVDDFEGAVAGHGTFMAGLVRMFCPDADILAVRVVHGDGIARESDVIHALAQLAELVRRHSDGEQDGLAIDVVVMSMAFYHETPDGNITEPALVRILEELGRLGVVVIAAAGNDATSRPAFPAAFAPWLDGRGPWSSRSVPVVSVGATNPDGSAALFSNAGPWVVAWQPGASLVSTMPNTFHGGLRPGSGADGVLERSSLDPDDYRSGFAVWSGTSFAAPVLAGRLAQGLMEDVEFANRPGESTEVRVSRAWRAVSSLVGLRP